MGKSAREIAMQALADTPDEVAKREEDELRRERSEDHRRRAERESTAMVATSTSEIERILDICVTEWEVVEMMPYLTVLRDPTDSAYHKLALSVRQIGNDRLEIRYAPYIGYGQRRESVAHPPRENWVSGPVITDTLSLGRALKEHENAWQRYHESLPTHMP